MTDIHPGMGRFIIILISPSLKACRYFIYNVSYR